MRSSTRRLMILAALVGACATAPSEPSELPTRSALSPRAAEAAPADVATALTASPQLTGEPPSGEEEAAAPEAGAPPEGHHHAH